MDTAADFAAPKGDLRALAGLVKRVTDPAGAAHYRKLYGLRNGAPAINIENWDEWNRLPFISKSVLQDIPIEERVFGPWESINSIHASSGTSGRPPHFTPWIRLDGYEYRERFHTFTRPALCSMPIHHQHEVFLDAHGVAPKLVIFDPRRARASVELAAKVGIDCLFIFTGHLTLIGPEVERLGIGDTITFIEIAGESCSRALFRYARRIFPKATIVSFYGATEVENPPISYPCRPLKDTEPLELHHPRRGYYLELIDPASGALIPIAAGAEGEIVITADTVSDQPQISPLVRYRTGDMARVIDDRCPEHGTWSFTMPGRVEMDFIKVPGGILRAEEVERVLGELAPGMSDFFELHFSEIESGGTVNTRIILHVESHPDQNLEQLARIIEQRLRVGAAFTYKDGVDRGMYLPIECRSYRHTYSGKRKRMIRDPHPTDS